MPGGTITLVQANSGTPISHTHNHFWWGFALALVVVAAIFLVVNAHQTPHKTCQRQWVAMPALNPSGGVVAMPVLRLVCN